MQRLITWWNARRTRTKVILVIIGLLALASLATPGSPPPSESPSPSAPVAQSPVNATPARTTAAPTPTPAPTPFNFGSGTKIVPTDVPAATYRTRTASAGCYWARLSGLGGTFGEISANENTDGPTVVTIAATDKGFQSTRCANFSADLSAITSSQTAAFGEGTFMVGVDIAPGTWRSESTSGCYWQRMRGFGGTFSEIIANENPGGSAVVAIAPSDKGFKSARCGTWTKVQ